MKSKKDVSMPDNEHLQGVESVRNESSLLLPIENRILTIRGSQVMIDRDLAELYGVDTKRLNEQVKRNIDRFPESFRFQLSGVEKAELVANCDRLENLKHSSVNPFAFTEQGVAMLSAVLKSTTAIKTSIRIIEAFVAMRSFLMNNASLFQRIEHLEMKQLRTDEKVDAILDKLGESAGCVKEGVFFNGQIFDAYALIANLIRQAKTRIVLIDNYVDDTVLVQLSKRVPGVLVDIYVGQISRQLRQDVERHNLQYPGVTLHHYTKAHDRFLIIDEEVYHIGASLKDLGKKLFAFSRMEVMTGSELIAGLQ